MHEEPGYARAHVALSDRQCLDAGTVRLLNATGRLPGGVGLRTSASHLAGPTGPGADAGAGGYATERDTAADIAPCRVG